MTNSLLHKDVAEICFPVERVSCRELFPGYTFVQGRHEAVFLPTRRKVVHFCSESYTLMPNRSLLMPYWEHFYKLLDSSALTPIIRSYDDRKFYVSLLTGPRQLQNDAAIRLRPSLEFRNSYDGSLKLFIGTGIWLEEPERALFGLEEELLLRQKRGGSDQLPPPESLQALWEGSFLRLRALRKLQNDALDAATIQQRLDQIRRQTSYPRRLLQDIPLRLLAPAESGRLCTWDLYLALIEGLHEPQIQLHWEFRERAGREVYALLQSSL